MRPAYKVFFFSHPPAESELNELGRLGFELVSLVYLPSNNGRAQKFWSGCFRNFHLPTLFEEERAISLIPCKQCQEITAMYYDEDKYNIGLSEYLLHSSSRDTALDLLRKLQTPDARVALYYWEKYAVIFQVEEEFDPISYRITNAHKGSQLAFSFSIYPNSIKFSRRKEKLLLNVSEARMLLKKLQPLRRELVKRYEAGEQIHFEDFYLKLRIKHKSNDQFINFSLLEIEFLVDHLLEAIEKAQVFHNSEQMNKPDTLEDLFNSAEEYAAFLDEDAEVDPETGQWYVGGTPTDFYEDFDDDWYDIPNETDDEADSPSELVDGYDTFGNRWEVSIDEFYGHYEWYWGNNNEESNTQNPTS